jgi:acyl-CoA thioester hydrolase
MIASRIQTPDDPRALRGDCAQRVTVDVRLSDTDAMGHVNNAVYLTYCEMARIRYWSDVTGEPLAARHHGAESLILAEARITYRAQVFHTDVVTVDSRATRIGRSSFVLEHRLTACEAGGHPRLVAISESVLVRYDYTVGRAAELDERFVQAMEAFEGHALR